MALCAQERTYIKVDSKTNNHQIDLKNSISEGDFRFVGILGYSFEGPGVPNYDEVNSTTNGVKIIEGTTDSYSYEDFLSFEDHEFFEKYAKEYNLNLLKYLAKQKNRLIFKK